MELDPAVACASLLDQEDVGPTTIAGLWRAYGSFAALARAALRGEDLDGGPTRPTERRVRAVRAAFTSPALKRAESRVRRWRTVHGAVVPLGDPGYPPSLAALHDPPPLLFVRGCLPAGLMGPPGRSRAVAVVGTRRATPWARDFAETCARELTRAGIVVVSGLALGVDGAAHRGALQASANDGPQAAVAGTVAVLAGGLDRPHPPSHAPLAQRVARSGALLSEHPPDTEPTKGAFPTRNRIVAGLARAVVVIEAPFRSGVRHTVTVALNEGRDVWVVPQRPDGVAGRAACELLRDGATPLSRAADIVEDWDGPGANESGRASPPTDPLQRAVLEALQQRGATSLDELAPPGASAGALLAALTALERNGTILRGSGGLWHLV